jgi:uncharacterized membrane protein YfcA
MVATKPALLVSPLRIFVRTGAQSVTGVSWSGTILLGTTALCLLLARNPGIPSVAIMVAIAAAAAFSSIGGFAFSAICGAVLFHLDIDRVQAVEIMMLCSVANQATMVWALRRNIDWRGLAVFLTGGALGLPVGLWLLLHADRGAYTYAFGALLVFYGTYMLLRRPFVVRHQYRAFDVAAGVLGGVTGGAIALPSAAVTVWCSMKGWDKDRQRALFQPFILVMQVAALLTLSLLRGTPSHLGIEAGALLCVPGSLLGTSVGLLCYRALSDRHFARAINLLLIVSGASYLL